MNIIVNWIFANDFIKRKFLYFLKIKLNTSLVAITKMKKYIIFLLDINVHFKTYAFLLFNVEKNVNCTIKFIIRFLKTLIKF